MADSAPITAKRMGLITGGEALSSADLSKLARSETPKTHKRAAIAKVSKAAHH